MKKKKIVTFFLRCFLLFLILKLPSQHAVLQQISQITVKEITGAAEILMCRNQTWNYGESRPGELEMPFCQTRI